MTAIGKKLCEITVAADGTGEYIFEYGSDRGSAPMFYIDYASSGATTNVVLWGGFDNDGTTVWFEMASQDNYNTDGWWTPVMDTHSDGDGGNPSGNVLCRLWGTHKITVTDGTQGEVITIYMVSDL